MVSVFTSALDLCIAIFPTNVQLLLQLQTMQIMSSNANCHPRSGAPTLPLTATNVPPTIASTTTVTPTMMPNTESKSQI